MKVTKLLMILATFLLLAGCLKTNVLERLSIVTALGYDAKKDHTFQVSASYLESLPDAKNKNRTVSVNAETSKGARRKINQKLPYELASGQVRVILLNRDIFHLRMINEIDLLSRDPSFGDMIKVAVVDGSVEELLSYKYESIPNIGTYLNSLLEHNTKYSWSPVMTLHEFTRCRDQNLARDMVLPLIKREGDEVILSNLQLLHGVHIVGEATPKEGYFLKAIRGEPTAYLYECLINKKDLSASGMNRYIYKQSTSNDSIKIVFKVVKSKGRVELTNASSLDFNVTIDMDVDVQEISERYDLKNDEAVNALKHQLNRELTADFQRLLDKLKSLNADCIGLGEKYRSQVSKAQSTKINWSKAFPTASIHGKVNLKILRTGTLE